MMQVVQMSVGGHVTDRFSVAGAAKGGGREDAGRPRQEKEGWLMELPWGRARAAGLPTASSTTRTFSTNSRRCFRACCPCSRVVEERGGCQRRQAAGLAFASQMQVNDSVALRGACRV